MPFCGEHDQALTLVCGEDTRLARSGHLLAVAAIMLVLAGGIAAELKLTLSIAVIAQLRFGSGRDGPGLLIRPRGIWCWRGQQGHVDSAAWTSRWYTVLRLHEAGRRQSVIVSASRQAPGEYRKLLAWLRLGRWDSEQRSSL